MSETTRARLRASRIFGPDQGEASCCNSSLIIGLGGSGGKTLRYLKQALEERFREIGWEEGMPDGLAATPHRHPRPAGLPGPPGSPGSARGR